MNRSKKNGHVPGLSQKQATAQSDELRRTKQELQQEKDRYRQLETRFRELEQKHGLLCQREARFDKTREVLRRENEDLRDERNRRGEQLVIMTEKLNAAQADLSECEYSLGRLGRTAARQADQLLQLRFLLQGAIYFSWLAKLIRRFQRYRSGPRLRSRRWQRVVRQRVGLIGGWHCELCGTRDAEFLGHHIIPHADGGPDAVENCQIRCEQCEHKFHDQQGSST